jgi:hypothetical protein
MERYRETYQHALNYAAGNIPASWGQGTAPLTVNLSNVEVRRGDGTGQSDDNPYLVNEMILAFNKTQGSADEIQIQIRESDDSFTTSVVVPIMGAEYYVIDGDVSDSTWIRIPIAIQLRGQEVRFYAQYSGGAATSAALDVKYKLCPTDQMSHQGATAITGPGGGLTAAIRKCDVAHEQGMARQTQRVISGGTWAADVVTFTTSADHGWVADDIVVVAGCGNANYDGTFTVVSAPTSTTWTAALIGDPGAFTTAGTGDQSHSTTRIVDEDKSWVASEFSNPGYYLEITDGTGMTEQRIITSNGTHWLGVTTALSSAPVTNDTTYKIVEVDVPALVVNTEATVNLGDIHLSPETGRYRSIEPDLVAGESALPSLDIKGNTRVAGAEAHDAAVNRAPVLMGGYASNPAPAAISDDGDVANAWFSVNGAVVIAGYNEDGTPSALNDATVIPIGTDNLPATDATPDIVKMGGEARAEGAAYTEGDSCILNFDLTGDLRVGGSVPRDVAAAGNPVLCGARGSDAAPAAISDDGDAVDLWAAQSGALVVAGYLEDGAASAANDATPIPIGTDNMLAQDTTPDIIKVGGEARAEGAAYTEGDSAILNLDLVGNLRVGGSVPRDIAATGNPVLCGARGSDAAPASISDDGDAVDLWAAQNGALVVAGYNEDGSGTPLNDATPLPIGTDNLAAQDATPDLLKVGGEARASGATYTEGDSALVSFDLLGCLRVGGAEPHDVGLDATANPLVCGAYASDVIQTAVSDAGDAVRLWASLSGALCTAGLYQHATPASAVSMTNPVVIDDAIMFTGATAIPVAGQYNATALTYTDKDACVFQMNVNGGLITTGGVGESDLTHGQKTVAAAGTEEALGGDVAITNGQKVLIKALHTNTGVVYVGDSDVTNLDGLQLYPGESVALAVTNLNVPYIDVDVNGEGVSYIVERS